MKSKRYKAVVPTLSGSGNLQVETSFNTATEQLESNRISPLPWLYNRSQSKIELDDLNLIKSEVAIGIGSKYGQSSSPTPTRSSYRTNRKFNELKRRQNRNKATTSGSNSSTRDGGLIYESQQGIDVSLSRYATANRRSVFTSVNPAMDVAGGSHQQRSSEQNRFWKSLRRKAREMKKILPTLEDINLIDKYSRLVFPSLFLLFNVCYWCYYFVQSTYSLKL